MRRDRHKPKDPSESASLSADVLSSAHRALAIWRRSCSRLAHLVRTTRCRRCHGCIFLLPHANSAWEDSEHSRRVAARILHTQLAHGSTP